MLFGFSSLCSNSNKLLTDPGRARYKGCFIFHFAYPNWMSFGPFSNHVHKSSRKIEIFTLLCNIMWTNFVINISIFTNLLQRIKYPLSPYQTLIQKELFLWYIVRPLLADGISFCWYFPQVDHSIDYDVLIDSMADERFDLLMSVGCQRMLAVLSDLA